MNVKEALHYQRLVWPTVEAIRAAGGSATLEEIEEYVADRLELTDEVLGEQHGDTSRTEFQYRLAWVRTYLKKIEAVDNSDRGVWSLTSVGTKLSEKEAKDVFRRVRAMRSDARSISETKDVGGGPHEVEQQDSWIDEMLKVIQSIDPSAFERLCQRLLRESGFTKVEVTGRPSDGGIDGNGVLRVNLVSFQVLFQCKRWKGSVGSSVVRDFRGAMVGRADKGLIITTSTFTPEARREATRDGAPAIDLIEGDELCHLLKSKRLGARVEMVERVEVLSSFFHNI